VVALFEIGKSPRKVKHAGLDLPPPSGPGALILRLVPLGPALFSNLHVLCFLEAPLTSHGDGSKSYTLGQKMSLEGSTWMRKPGSEGPDSHSANSPSADPTHPAPATIRATSLPLPECC
jgi:hypothetical protein